MFDLNEYVAFEKELEKAEPLTKEKAISLLKQLSESNDFESTHELADQILVKFINDKEIETAYNNVGKWYS